LISDYFSQGFSQHRFCHRALLRGDLKAVLDRQRAQLGQGPHAAFCKELEKRRSPSA
jgi:hypothetical protein